MNVSILGFGEYGRALTSVFLEKEANVVSVWNKFDDVFFNLGEKYLRGILTTDLRLATKDADLIVVAIPIAFLDETMDDLRKCYRGQDILIASKGIDINSQLFAYEIVKKYLGDVPIGVISGGTFAKDMQTKKVMGITLGTGFERIKEKVKSSFECDYLRVQYVDDMIGVSICGAIKNVMAIGFGMLEGADYPPSSRFLFLTEAIYEIRDLIGALGGDSNTVMSYAGIDDIMMTCTSNQSRNYTLGSMLGKEFDSGEINEYKKNTTIEGLGTALAIYKLAKVKNIDLPLTNVIYRILYENASIDELVRILEKRES